MYHKNFDAWNERKQIIHLTGRGVSYARERDVFLCSLGYNIGREQDGNDEFERPVLVVKKFNSDIVWVVPLTTKQKDLDFYYNFTDPHNLPVAAILAQLRLISTKRLIRRLYVMEEQRFDEIRKRMRAYLT